MIKKLTGLISIVSLVLGIWGGIARAADYADVTATVTVQNIAITLASDGSIAYGTLVAGGTQTTLPSGVNDMQTVQNSGNVTEKFLIKGYNATGCSWTLGSDAGSETYAHKFCNDTQYDCTTPDSNYTALTTNNQDLATSVNVNGTVDIQFKIKVPTSTSCTDEATVKVTITAQAAS